MRELINLYGLTRSQLEELFVAQGLQSFRGRQLMKWIYHSGISDFSEMTDLPLVTRDWLFQHAELGLPNVVFRQESTDGTVKWAIQVHEDECVEMVLIPEKGRNTLCVSSQVGCSLDCSFCSTGKQGFNGNLSAAEIVGQLLLANQYLESKNEVVTNVVFMGMGEPLLNFESVLSAANIIMDDMAFGLSKRKVTISSSGVVPAIEKLSRYTDCSLAISLHAPNDSLRDQLVPINRRYPIDTLLAACRKYLNTLGPHRKLLFEYTLIDHVNDQTSHAQELANLLSGIPCKINLIPFNDFDHSGYRTPAQSRVFAFQSVLIERGYTAMIRSTRGEDISAACGQLAGNVRDRTKRSERYRESRAPSSILVSENRRVSS